MMQIEALWEELEGSLIPLLTKFRSQLGELKVTTKADHSFLSEADIAVQEHIVDRIRTVDPDAMIVAEEDGVATPLLGEGKYVWIVDPIDGTSQFVRPDGVEFCSVICLLEDRRPIAALVVAPEIGHNRSPVVVRVAGPDQSIEVNGAPVAQIPALSRNASITRGGGFPSRPWEKLLQEFGFTLKTQSTSQTLDMVRTTVDLAPHVSSTLPPFAVFYRDTQKVWDGAAGMCFAQHQGLRICDATGTDRHTVDLDLTVRVPSFGSTLVAAPAVAAQILPLISSALTVE